MDLTQRLLGIDVSALSDADKTLPVVDPAVRAMIPDVRMAGPAFTVLAEDDHPGIGLLTGEDADAQHPFARQHLAQLGAALGVLGQPFGQRQRDIRIEAERDLCPAHGLFRLPWQVASLRSGKVNGRARPRVEALAPAVVWVSRRDENT